jgi:hypothetical protein
MEDPLSKAERYRKAAVKCHERAKTASPVYLGDFYRRVAVRYLFMAEDVLRRAEKEGHCARTEVEPRDRRATRGDQDIEMLASWAGEARPPRIEKCHARPRQ